jgi:hypothetical protein
VRLQNLSRWYTSLLLAGFAVIVVRNRFSNTIEGLTVSRIDLDKKKVNKKSNATTLFIWLFSWRYSKNNSKIDHVLKLSGFAG